MIRHPQRRDGAGALERLIEGRTTFLITHPLSMLGQFDQIPRLDNGRVARLPAPEPMAASRVMR